MPYLIDDVHSGNVWESLKSQNSVEIDKTKADYKRDQHQKYKLKRYIRHNKSNKLDLRMVSNQATVSSEIVRIPHLVYRKFRRYKNTRVNYTSVDVSYEFFDSSNLHLISDFKRKPKRKYGRQMFFNNQKFKKNL